LVKVLSSFTGIYILDIVSDYRSHEHCKQNWTDRDFIKFMLGWL